MKLPGPFLQLMIRAKEEIKNETFEQNKNNKNKSSLPPEEKDLLGSKNHYNVEMKLPGMNRPLKPVPVFKQHPGENKRAFYYRMDKTIQSMKSRKDWEKRYGVDVTTDEQGQTRVVEHEKDEIELEIEKKKKEKLAKRGIIVKSKEEKRKLRREREKKRKNKNKRKDDSKDFSDFQDCVSFGETVHAPPTIKDLNNETRRPGQKDLLLKKSFGGVKKTIVGVQKPKQSLAKKVIMEKERHNETRRPGQKDLLLKKSF